MPQFDLAALLPTLSFIVFIMFFSFLIFCEFFLESYIIKNKLELRFLYYFTVLQPWYIIYPYSLKH